MRSHFTLEGRWERRGEEKDGEWRRDGGRRGEEIVVDSKEEGWDGSIEVTGGQMRKTIWRGRGDKTKNKERWLKTDPTPVSEQQEML